MDFSTFLQSVLYPLKNFEINNLQDLSNFHQKLVKLRIDLLINNGFQTMPHYRGEQNYGWDLLPGIQRPPFSDSINLTNSRIIEKEGVALFKQKIIENYGHNKIFKRGRKPFGEYWDLLFQAQHAGIKTNLIDFSCNIEHASFFICEPSSQYENSDGQLWALIVPYDYLFHEDNPFNNQIYPNINPYELTSSFLCNIPTYNESIEEKTYQFRLYRQKGRLFASSNSDLSIPLNKREIWSNLLIRLRIKSQIKKTIFKDLEKIGINKKSLILTESEDGVAKKLIEEINDAMKNFH